MDDTRIGPVQLIVIGFEGNQFQGRIVSELRELRARGMIRLLDLLFIVKNAEGDVAKVRGSDLTDEEAARYGAIAGGLLGLGVGLGATGNTEGAAGGAAIGALVGAATFANHDYTLTREELREIADEIPADSAVAVALLEHRWAIGFKEAVLDAGGTVLASGLVSAEALVLSGAALGAALAAAEQN